MNVNYHKRTGSLLRSFLVLAGLVVTATDIGCIRGIPLRTEAETAALKEGSYTMLLYGCNYPDRLDNAAILAPEGGKYRFELSEPSFAYKVRTSVSAKEALGDAEKFLQCSIHYRKYGVRRILDLEGNTMGYEVRPLYSPIEYGREDVLSISYRLDGDRAVAYIWLDRDIDLKINDDGNGQEENGEGGHAGR